MNTESDIAEAVATTLSELPPAQQQEVLDFVEFLRQRQEPRPSILEKIESLSREVPEDVWKELPPDGAEQHDHYLYGTPKRKT